MAWGYGYGAMLVLISVIPAVTGSGVNADASLWVIGPAGWRAICFSAFVTSAFNYVLMASINHVTSPLTVMSFYPVQSIATPLLSAAILGAPLAATDAGGGVVICIGLLLLSFARWREGSGGGGKGHQQMEEEGGTGGSSAAPVEGGGGGVVGGTGAGAGEPGPAALEGRTPGGDGEEQAGGLPAGGAAQVAERTAATAV